VIKPEYQEHIQAWQEQEPDENLVAKVQDSARAITSLKSTAEESCKTEYKSAYKPTHGKQIAKRTVQLQDKEGFIKTDLRHRNYSRVPVGSIYEMDSWEIEASNKRDREEALRMAEFEKEAIKLGERAAKGLYEQANLVMYVPASQRPTGPSEMQRLFKIQSMGTGRKWMSEYRTAFLGGRKAHA
jgi:hypothetical protein